jgi:hypothetical protein
MVRRYLQKGLNEIRRELSKGCLIPKSDEERNVHYKRGEVTNSDFHRGYDEYDSYYWTIGKASYIERESTVPGKFLFFNINRTETDCILLVYDGRDFAGTKTNKIYVTHADKAIKRFSRKVLSDCAKREGLGLVFGKLPKSAVEKNTICSN